MSTQASDICDVLRLSSGRAAAVLLGLVWFLLGSQSRVSSAGSSVPGKTAPSRWPGVELQLTLHTSVHSGGTESKCVVVSE